jgi:hypothetical protein
MKINKTEVIMGNLRIKCTFDTSHDSTSAMYYVESLLDDSIFHVGHGNANYEMTEKEMDDYIIKRANEIMRLDSYKNHVSEFDHKYKEALKIHTKCFKG